jgi:ribosome recycling factor
MMIMTTKNAYIEAMKRQLDELNANLNKIETKAKEAKGEARDAYFAEMRKLRHQSKLAVTKFEEIKLASEDGWEKMVTEMDKVRDAFTHSFHYFKSQV